MCVFQVRFNLLQYVVPDVKELYNWLEVDFHPLKLSGRVTKVNNLAAKHLIRRKIYQFIFVGFCLEFFFFFKIKSP